MHWLALMLMVIGTPEVAPATPPEVLDDAPAALRCPAASEAPLGPCLDTRHGVVRTPPIRFDIGRAQITPDGIAVVQALASWLESAPDIELLEIQGHLLPDPKRESYGRDLSKDRARAVRDFLISRGIAAARLEFKGYGESLPLVDPRGPDRMKNVRIELRVTKWRGRYPRDTPPPR